MSISDLHPRQTPAAVLAEAVALLRDMGSAWWTHQPDDQVVAAVELGAELRSVTAAVEAAAVAEADHRALAKDTLNYGSTGDWLTHVGGLRKGQGRRIVARAHAVTGPFATTRDAMAAGRVSPEQADVIVQAIDQLRMGEALRVRGERVLLEQTGCLDASDLARTGRHLVHVVDPDATDRKLEAQLDREERSAHLGGILSIASDGAGGVRLKGRGSAEDGALLKAALLPLTAPAPAVDDHHGELVHDPCDAGARMWDALVQTAQLCVATDLPPDSHGAPARLLVTVDLHTLTDTLAEQAITGAVGVGLTGDGAELSAATIRRLACDAEIVPVVLGTHREPLDVGRTRRPVTLAIWAALVVRYRHCAFPGCERLR